MRSIYMNKKEIFNEKFRKQLQADGYPVLDIKNDLAVSSNPIRVLRSWTNLSNDVLKNGLVNKYRDILAPNIYLSLTRVLNPWIKNQVDDVLPQLRAKELARRTGMSVRKVVEILSRYPYSVSINGIEFTTEITEPNLPKNRLRVKNSREFKVSPKKVIKEARYQSHKPGGGPIIKSGLQNRDVDRTIRRMAEDETIIKFKRVTPTDQVSFEVMEALEIDTVPAKKSVEALLYSEPNGQDLMRVFEWFKQVGFGKNWVYKDQQSLFAENLVKLSRGEPVDFLIWNCIGFKWFADGKNMPTCDIRDNLDAAITPYFQERIKELAQVLSSIGDPQITILVPSNEALDERVWRYRQSNSEREAIITITTEELAQEFTEFSLPTNARLQVLRWDDYLRSKNIKATAQRYSQEGEMRLKTNPNFEQMVNEAVRSGRGYFAQNGITGISDEVFAKRQIQYYGVYAGEGVVFEELQQKGQGVVVINFEEMRVPQMAFLGARGILSIVTPITNQEMVNYYQWEARQIAKRL